MTTTVPTATSLTASAAPSPRLPIRVPLPGQNVVAAATKNGSAVVQIREGHIERRGHHVLGHNAVAQRNAEATETEGYFRTNSKATRTTNRQGSWTRRGRPGRRPVARDPVMTAITPLVQRSCLS